MITVITITTTKSTCHKKYKTVITIIIHNVHVTNMIVTHKTQEFTEKNGPHLHTQGKKLDTQQNY
jgi:hypothetical protein